MEQGRKQERRISTLAQRLAAPDSEHPESTRSTSDRVREAIRELILSGVLSPGSRIGQDELALRFSVSRLPVREALNRLESDGLVVLKRNSGAWVAKLDLAECLEVYQIRERLEPLALLQAAKNMQSADIDRLSQLVTEMAATADSETFLRLDREFHLASYRPAGMHQLFQMTERFWNSTQHYRRAFIKLQGQEGSWIIHAEHRLIIDALRRGDSEGAVHLLREHIRRTRYELARREEIFADKGSPKPRYRSNKA